MSIPQMTKEDKDFLKENHARFDVHVNSAAWKTAIAASLLLPSIIVIFCSSLTLILPGMNSVNGIILKGLLPGSCGIAIAVPLFYFAHFPTMEKKKLREELLAKIEEILDTHIHPRTKNDGCEFILENVLFFGSMIYKQHLISEIKNRYTKYDKNPAIQRINTCLDMALIAIIKPRSIPEPARFLKGRQYSDSATGASTTEISWKKSLSYKVVSYTVERDADMIGSVKLHSYTDRYPIKKHRYIVKAVDRDGKISEPVSILI